MKKKYENLELILQKAIGSGIISGRAKLEELQGQSNYAVMNGNERVGTLHDLCGFSYCYISVRTLSRRSKVVKDLLKKGILSYDDYRRALHVRIPFIDQGIRINEASATACCQTLKEFGIEAFTESRLD